MLIILSPDPDVKVRNAGVDVVVGVTLFFTKVPFSSFVMVPFSSNAGNMTGGRSVK